MASREEILANFQACTGVEDVEVAICQLEAAEWVLVDAVNKAMTSGPTAAAAPISDPAPEPPLPQTPTSDASTSSSGPSSSAPPVPNRWERLEDPMPPPPPPMAQVLPSAAFGEPSAASISAGIGAGSAFSAFPGAASVSISDDFFAGPSSSRTRMLDFFITHHDRTIHLKVPDNEDVKTLKTLVHGETGFPPCQLAFRGFKGSSPLPPTDRRKLSDLNLPRENFLQLVVQDSEDAAAAGGSNGEKDAKEVAVGDFRLNITNEVTGRTYNLNFRPTQTVLQMKIDLSHLTDIPVSKQLWTGWPENVNDQLSLAQLGIPQEFSLLLNRKENMPIVIDDDGASTSSTSGVRPPRRQNSDGAVTGGSSSSRDAVVVMDSDDEFEDANDDVVMDDDDIFGSGSGGASGNSSGPGRGRIQPLIPDDYGDEALAGVRFSEEFSNRYGNPSPDFFRGSLNDAIKESCMQPAKYRKMLAIYLHHDHSVLTNVFCTQAMCADSVVSFLNENFVSFGWDLTHSSNKSRLLAMVTQHFGSVAAATIRNLGIERLPLLTLVYRLRGTTEIFQIIHGNVTLDELMSQLLSAHDAYTTQLSVEVRDEGEREARNEVKREQDLAFEMAEHADREKEAQKKRQADERLEQERIEEAKQRSEEEAKAKAEKIKEAKRKVIAKRLPKEPKEGGTEKAARIRFRVVGGENTESRTFERRFLASDALQIVFDFLTVEGLESPNCYKVISSWPRRDLTTLDDFSQTLEALKLFPQETLTLEEK